MKGAAYFLLTLMGVATVLGPDSAVPPRLIYNASASAPVGWYRVTPASAWRVGDLVLARLPHPVRELAAARGYLPERVPVLKHVVAAEGDDVCVRQDSVWVAGRAVALLAHVDGRGRALAAWPGCRDLLPGEVFLMNEPPASFDSRYFGPIDQSYIVGVATPWSVR